MFRSRQSWLFVWHGVLRSAGSRHQRYAQDLWQGDEQCPTRSPEPGRSRPRRRQPSSTREWASTYDDDVFGALGVTGSARIAELLVGVLTDPAQPVVDLGCGTGAVGQRLAQLGVTTIDGIDLSPEMITVAARTGAYRSLTVGDLNDLPDASERDVCSVGERRHLHHGTRGAGRRSEIDGVATSRGRRRVGDRGRGYGLDSSPCSQRSGWTCCISRSSRSGSDAPPEAVMFVARLR